MQAPTYISDYLFFNLSMYYNVTQLIIRKSILQKILCIPKKGSENVEKKLRLIASVYA